MTQDITIVFRSVPFSEVHISFSLPVGLEIVVSHILDRSSIGDNAESV